MFLRSLKFLEGQSAKSRFAIRPKVTDSGLTSSAIFNLLSHLPLSHRKEKGMNSSQNSDQKVNYQPVPDCELAILSQDRTLNKVLKTVISEVKHYAEDQIKHIKQSAEIGKALSAERDIGKLLEMIVDEARAIKN